MIAWDFSLSQTFFFFQKKDVFLILILCICVSMCMGV